VEEVSRSRNEAAREKGHAMAQCLISFPSNAMDQIPEEEMPDVANAAHAVCQEAIDAGVYLLAGGLEDRPASIVATDGTVTDGPNPDFISGITIVDVPSREEALKVGCQSRCRVPLHTGGPSDRIRPRTRRDVPQGCEPTATSRRRLIEGGDSRARRGVCAHRHDRVPA
jgi:hypothetical protein